MGGGLQDGRTGLWMTGLGPPKGGGPSAQDEALGGGRGISWETHPHPPPPAIRTCSPPHRGPIQATHRHPETAAPCVAATIALLVLRCPVASCTVGGGFRGGEASRPRSWLCADRQQTLPRTSSSWFVTKNSPQTAPSALSADMSENMSSPPPCA